MKEYMTPAIEMVEIETEEMVANSVSLFEDEVTDPNDILIRDYYYN